MSSMSKVFISSVGKALPGQPPYHLLSHCQRCGRKPRPHLGNRFKDVVCCRLITKWHGFRYIIWAYFKCYLYFKISIPPEPVSKYMWQQMPGPDSSNGKSNRHESEGWGRHESECRGFESPSGRDIFCLKNLTFSQEHPLVCRKLMLLPAHS